MMKPKHALYVWMTNATLILIVVIATIQSVSENGWLKDLDALFVCQSNTILSKYTV